MTALTANTSATANAMATEIFGPGFQINTATYSGDNNSSAIYTNGDTTNPNVLPSDVGVILSTGNVANFGNATGGNNQSAGDSTDTGGVDGDGDFNTEAGGATFDASFLTVNFTPLAGQTSLNLEFRFYSEEYNEYVYSDFNDVALIMIDSVQVPISVGDGTISVNSINNAGSVNPQFGNQANDPNPGNNQFDSANPNLYIDNANGAFDTEMDGFTVTLSLDIPVTPGVAQTLKIGIADKGDAVWDSNLVIASNNQSGPVDNDPVATDDAVTVASGLSTTTDLLVNDSDPNAQALTITEINGVAVSAGSMVTLSTGQIITLNANGTITIAGNGAPVGTTAFAYTIEDTDGNSDSAFVTLTTVPPCFTPGTMITTPRGPVTVESLNIGDMVLTRDNGLQPIRWIGRRVMTGARMFAASGALNPVVIPAHAFGPGQPAVALSVSPMHRILVRGSKLTLTIGHEEALIPAKYLIGKGNVHASKHAFIEMQYFHILFDTHQIIFANQVPTESLHPGHIALAGFMRQDREALFAVRPELRSNPGAYGNTARYVLRHAEHNGMDAEAYGLIKPPAIVELAAKRPENRGSAPSGKQRYSNRHQAVN